MIRKEKIERLENLRQKYLTLRNYIIYYKDVLNYNNELNEQKVKDNIKVKKLVLTKSFYGRDLQVG